MSTSRRTTITVAAIAALSLLPALQSGVAAAPETPSTSTAPSRDVYAVSGTDAVARTAIIRTGAQVVATDGSTAEIEATPAQADRLRQQGFQLTYRGNVAELAERRGTGRAGDFPPGDEAYHTYDEIQSELDTVAQDHADLAQKLSVGKSWEGRDVPMMKISDNVAQDENEPEVLFNCNIHAREHLTAEMCMHIVNRFTDGYADPAIKKMVDEREIWVVPMTNPDGAIKDIEGGQYQSWRKNTQDGHGTDPNRNFDYKWGCCGGSSGEPSSETYRGTAPASAPEVANLQRFADSRVVDGVQQIKAHIDWHTYSELVLWPFGYTYDEVTEHMTREEYDRFKRVGTAMAETNGYTPKQSSGLYITDGTTTDWMWGKHKILSYTFEMYPKMGNPDGFYPPASLIEQETTRNDAAVDMLITEAGA